MFKISLSDGLGIGDIVLTTVLLVLDKAGKLKGRTLFVLLGVAALLTISLALVNPWVANAPSAEIAFFRGMGLVCLVIWGYMVLTACISGPGTSCIATEATVPSQPAASIRIKYSSRQTVQISNVPGDYNQTLNLDNVATLRLLTPRGSDAVALLWPSSPSVVIAEPRQGGHYIIRSGGGATVQFPQVADGSMMIKDATIMGPGQLIWFDLDHPFQLIDVGDRIFRVSLESIRDKANGERRMFFEYEFAISEADRTAANEAAAISRDPKKLQEDKAMPESAQAMLAAMGSQAVGTITLRLREVADGRPNVVTLSAGTKSLLFDPTARVVAFHMLRTGGRPVDLRLPLKTVGPDGKYFVVLVWDDAKGARLHVNDAVTNDGLP